MSSVTQIVVGFTTRCRADVPFESPQPPKHYGEAAAAKWSAEKLPALLAAAQQAMQWSPFVGEITSIVAVDAANKGLLRTSDNENVSPVSQFLSWLRASALEPAGAMDGTAKWPFAIYGFGAPSFLRMVAADAAKEGLAVPAPFWQRTPPSYDPHHVVALAEQRKLISLQGLLAMLAVPEDLLGCAASQYQPNVDPYVDSLVAGWLVRTCGLHGTSPVTGGGCDCVVKPKPKAAPKPKAKIKATK